jgi:hypothetical protein
MNLCFKKPVQVIPDTNLGPPKKWWKKTWVLAIILAGFASSVVPITTFAATIEGVKFIDFNRNGIKDNGEELASETIYLKSVDAPSFISPWERLTGPEGQFGFSNLSTGAYQLWEAANQPSGLQTVYNSQENAQTVTIETSTDNVLVNFLIPLPPLTLTIKNGTEEIAINFSSADPPPPLEVKIGSTINFEVSVDETSNVIPFQVTWDLGDGQTIGPIPASSNPLIATANHSYSNTGDFTVTTTVTYQNSITEITTATVKIKKNSNPVVTITSPIANEPVLINAGDSYTLTATLTDPDQGDTHWLEWGIWDGGNWVRESTSVTAPYTLNIPYTVSNYHSGKLNMWVYARDNDYGRGYDRVTLTNLGIHITTPTGDELQNLVAGQPVEFKATLTDLENVENHRVYWRFGDYGWKSWKRLSVSGNPAEITASHTYAGGDFTVWVYAYDNNWRRWTSDRMTLHINGPANSNPTVEIALPTAISATSARRTTRDGIEITSPLQINRGETVNFDITVNDVDNFNEHRVYVSFGDGGWLGPIAITSVPQTITVSHAYAGGNFTLWVYVQDDNGGWVQKDLPIEVSGYPNVKPTIEITSPVIAVAGLPTKLNVNIKDSDTFQTPLKVNWWFGDRTWSEEEVDNPSTNPVFHIYNTAGIYNVRGNVYDGSGGWASENVTVNVQNSLAGISTTDSHIQNKENSAKATCVDPPYPTGYNIVNSTKIWNDNDISELTDKTVIVIEESATATLSTSSNLKIKAICNRGTLIVNTSNLIETDLIANYPSGIIQGVDGESSTDRKNAGELAPNYDSGKPGGSVNLKVYRPSTTGNECIGLFLNEGIIRAGYGGNGYQTGGQGGSLKVKACDVVQAGFLVAGNGGRGNAQQPQLDGLSNWENYRNMEIYGGDGGQIVLHGELFYGAEGSVTNSGIGGDAKVWRYCEKELGKACDNLGDGGDTTLFFNKLEQYGDQPIVVKGKTIYFEPNIILSGKGTQVIAEEDIVIFGGDGWKLQLNDLRDDAISAGRDIIIAVGQNGVVDLRGNASKVFKAGGKVKIYTDNLLLDDGVELADLVEATEIEVNPAKIIYHASFTGENEVRVKPSSTTPISLKLANVGPSTDTYNLTIKRVKKDLEPEILEKIVPPFMSSQDFKILEDVTEAQGWTINGLPETVTVEGLTQTELALNVSSPSTLGEQETFVITATSQADPSMKATFEVKIEVAEETQRTLGPDSDNDGVVDRYDAFPSDPTEWMDSDNDKIGNNADTDDDNDEMPDEWEQQYPQLYVTHHDAERDVDNDGYSNLEEYRANTNPVDPSNLILRTLPNSLSVCSGDNFEIQLQVVPTNSSQPINAAQAYLSFDPTQLQVNNITSGSSLDMVLETDFNNTDGYIHFGAANFFNPTPTETFELMTLHFTALGDSGSAALYFDSANTFVVSGSEQLPQSVPDLPITFQCQLKYQVGLQERATPPHPSWVTTLKLSGDVTGTVTSNESGQGQLPQALASGNYTLCVKNAHTLQNQVTFTVPLASEFIDFGTLLEGDADNDNHIDLMDFVHVYLSKDQCEGDPNYNVNADFNADGCVGITDAQLLANNYGQAGQSCGDTPAAAIRRRPRDSREAFSLSVPENLTVGSRFEVPIRVYANADQPVGSASAHLHFDPQQVQVNSLTKGNHSLDFLLQNRFDNTLGTIDFVAVVWNGQFVTEPFTLVTLDLTLLAEGGEQTLALVSPSGVTTVGGTPTFPGQCPPAADISPVACQFYAVANEILDQDILNNSQLFTFNRETHAVESLGPLYKGYDLQALAIHPQTNRLYAVSGAQAAEQQHKGRLYLVDGNSGDLCWVGDTTFDNVSELAFSPDGSILWGWAEGQGLIQIDPTTGEGQLVRPLEDVSLAGFTLAENAVFLGVVNNELWKYNRPAEAFERLCANLPDTIDVVEMTATEGLLLGIPNATGLGLYPFNPEPTRCELGTAIEIPLQPQRVIADVVLPTAACTQ